MKIAQLFVIPLLLTTGIGYSQEMNTDRIIGLLDSFERGNTAAADEILRLGLPAVAILRSLPRSTDRRDKTVALFLRRLTALPMTNVEHVLTNFGPCKQPRVSPFLVTIIESEEERRVWFDLHNARVFDHLSAANEDSLSILCFNFPSNGQVFRSISGQISDDGKVSTIRVTLEEERYLKLPARDGADAGLFCRSVGFQRGGKSVEIIAEGIAGDRISSITFSGGGLSPVDAENATLAQAEAAFQSKDYMAVRRWLRRIMETKSGADIDLNRFIGDEDPFTSYWAARILCGLGDVDRLRKRCIELKGDGRLNDYIVSAVFHAAIDSRNDVAQKGILENRDFLKDICIYDLNLDPNYNRAGWLFVFLRSVMPIEHWEGLVKGFEAGPEQAGIDLAKRVRYEVSRRDDVKRQRPSNLSAVEEKGMPGEGVR